MPRAPRQPDAAARLIEAAQEFLADGAAAYIRGGAHLVADAERAGCRFAVSIVIPEGRAKIELIHPLARAPSSSPLPSSSRAIRWPSRGRARLSGRWRCGDRAKKRAGHRPAAAGSETMDLTNILTAIFTGVVAFFSMLVYVAYYKIEWHTGSLDTHSELELWFRTQEWNAQHPEQKLDVIWWDPSLEPVPHWNPAHPDHPRHGAPLNRRAVYFMLPLHLRKRPPSVLDRILPWRWRYLRPSPDLRRP